MLAHVSLSLSRKLAKEEEGHVRATHDACQYCLTCHVQFTVRIGVAVARLALHHNRKRVSKPRNTHEEP